MVDNVLDKAMTSAGPADKPRGPLKIHSNTVLTDRARMCEFPIYELTAV